MLGARVVPEPLVALDQRRGVLRLEAHHDAVLVTGARERLLAHVEHRLAVVGALAGVFQPGAQLPHLLERAHVSRILQLEVDAGADRTVGDAYDNAMAESLFSTLEHELLARQPLKANRETELDVFTYIE